MKTLNVIVKILVRFPWYVIGMGPCDSLYWGYPLACIIAELDKRSRVHIQNTAFAVTGSESHVEWER